MDKKRTLLICAAILIAGAILTAVTYLTEPTATRSAATRKSAMLVDATEVRKGTHRPVIIALGTVEASQDITLSPRVGGEVVSLSPVFTPGGFAEKGDILLQIDPADYRNALQQKQSDFQQEMAALKIEMGRQNVAQKDFQLLDQALTTDVESLVLREPQLTAARAMVEAARAMVDQAELDLKRTTIRAPFDAHILSRKVNVGSQVSAREDLGRIVGRETYWVIATVPLSKLPWLAFPKNASETGASVRIRNRSSWPEDVSRTGTLHSLIGALEEQTRMARVLISVPDPLAYRPENEGLPPLMIGTFVEVQIEAGEIPDVVQLNRDYLRANNTVWVVQDETLAIRPVKIVFEDAGHAYISDGLSHRDRVVTTNLSSVRDGASLRLKEDAAR